MRLWHGWYVVLGFVIAGAAMASAGNDGSAAVRGIVAGASSVPPIKVAVHPNETLQGSISGRILGGRSKNLTVKLESARYYSGASFEYSVSPAPDGTFHFANVDPGVYTLGVGGKGFETNEYGALHGGERGIPIVVRRGARIQGLTLRALKLSAICGRVTDRAGRPQPQMRIFIESFKNGYMRGGGSAPDHVVTDVNGIFHADGFTPGNYFIGFPARGYIRFFSSDGSLRAAVPLRLRAGHDAGCTPGSLLELQLPTVTEALHTISGFASGNLGPAVGDRFWVLLMDENADGAQEIIAHPNLDAKHRFTIENFPNGHYTLELRSAYGREPRGLSGPYPPTSHLLAKRPIDVRGANVSDVKIKAMELPTVEGRVIFTNLPDRRAFPGFDKTTVGITLVPRIFQAPYSAQINSDQTFRMGPLDTGEYEVRLSNNFVYIRSVRLNGHAIAGRYLRIGPNESDHLEIEISGNGGRLNFTVLPDPSLPKPVPHANEVRRGLPLWAVEGMQVVLLPDPLFTDGSNHASSRGKPFLLAHRVGDRNRTWLQLSNVPPGKYRAIAAERLSGISFGSLSDTGRRKEHALLQALWALGKPLTVTANSTKEITLPDKTIDVDRLAAKMGVAIGSQVLSTR